MSLVKLNDTDAAKSLRDAAKLEGHPERIGMTVYVNGLKKLTMVFPVSVRSMLSKLRNK